MTRLVKWFLALPIFKAAGVFLAALFFGLAAGAVARQKGRAEAMGRRAEEMAGKGTAWTLKLAAKETEKAEAAKQRAEAAKTAAEARLDNIGATDDTLADLVSDWNSDRLRD